MDYYPGAHSGCHTDWVLSSESPADSLLPGVFSLSCGSVAGYTKGPVS